MESNAKELKTVPLAEFPGELINTLIERYNDAMHTISISTNSERHLVKYHIQTIREVLSVFNISPDEQ